MVGFNACHGEMGKADAILGAPYRIDLPESAKFVRIYYSTSPNASGLQWLTPAQTTGKKHPFLFSQSQAINARSWVPLQDSPGVRITYGAKIRTPKGLFAIMSAENDALCSAERRIQLPTSRVDPTLPDGDCGWRHRVPAAHETHWGVCRARGGGQSRGRVFRHEPDARSGGSPVWPVSLGPLRRSGAAAEFSVRRHGESPSHISSPRQSWPATKAWWT